MKGCLTLVVLYNNSPYFCEDAYKHYFCITIQGQYQKLTERATPTGPTTRYHGHDIKQHCATTLPVWHEDWLRRITASFYEFFFLRRCFGHFMRVTGGNKMVASKVRCNLLFLGILVMVQLELALALGKNFKRLFRLRRIQWAMKFGQYYNCTGLNGRTKGSLVCWRQFTLLVMTQNNSIKTYKVTSNGERLIV